MTDPAPAAEGQAAAPAAAPEAQGQAPAALPESKWYDAAPDEIKGYIQNKGWDDPVKAVTSYQELEKFRGASEDQLLKLPKDMAEEGAMDAIYNRLGRPETADKYTVDVPDGVELDGTKMAYYSELAHKNGISQAQFANLVAGVEDFTAQGERAQNEAEVANQEAEYQALVKEWGANATEREELSRRGLRALIPNGMDADETVGKIEAAIGTAATLKLFANAGDFGREAPIHDSGGDRPFGYTKEQATADKAALMSELKAEPERLGAYNKGVGKDYEKMQRINKIVAS